MGKTAVISTHILPDVQDICDWVIILANGRIVISEQLEVLNLPAAPGFTIRVLGDATRFADRLGSQFAETTVRDPETIIVRDPASNLLATIWAIAREEGIGIRALIPAKNSLEEIFIQAVRGNNRANS